MNKIISLCAVTLTLVGCATHDPRLAPGVQRKGGGLYSISEMGNMFTDITAQAVKQCEMDGNKKLNIVGTTTQNSYISNETYAVILFRCDKKGK